MWGPSTIKIWGERIEKLQKLFLINQLQVKTTTPYHIMLIEMGVVPIEIHSLHKLISYIQQLSELSTHSLPYQALSTSKKAEIGWFSQAKR